jgi:hypothetical protein
VRHGTARRRPPIHTCIALVRMQVLWQKHICCRVKRDLWVGSAIASVLVALTCMAWGVPGMVAAWKGIADHSYGFWGTSYVLYIDK